MIPTLEGTLELAPARQRLYSAPVADVPAAVRAALAAAGLESDVQAGQRIAITAGSRYVPPLFIWIVDSAGEDLRLGFRRAAELYEERAQSRIQIMLYAVLPVSVLTVGSLVVGQAFLITSMYVVFIDLFNNLGG